MNLLFSFEKMFPIPKKVRDGNLIISEKSSLAVPGIAVKPSVTSFGMYSIVKLTFFNYSYLSFRFFFYQKF